MNLRAMCVDVPKDWGRGTPADGYWRLRRSPHRMLQGVGGRWCRRVMSVTAFVTTPTSSVFGTESTCSGRFSSAVARAQEVRKLASVRGGKSRGQMAVKEFFVSNCLTREQLIATRIPVVSEENKKQLLTVLMYNEGLYEIATGELRSEDFDEYDAHFRVLWECLQSLHAEMDTLPPVEMLRGRIQETVNSGHNVLVSQELDNLYEFIDWAVKLEEQTAASGKSMSGSLYVKWGTDLLKKFLKEAVARETHKLLDTDHNEITKGVPLVIANADERLERINALGEKEAPAAAGNPDDEFVDFPLEALPEAIQSFVAEHADSLSADRVTVVLAVLPVLAAAIGMSRCIQGKPGHIEPPIIWGGLIAKSGAKKSSAFRKAFKPLLEIQMKATEAYKKAKAAYDASQKGKATHTTDPAPREPKPPYIALTNTTIEGANEALSVESRGVPILSDELAAFMSILKGKYGQGAKDDSAEWISAYGGDPGSIMRASKPHKNILHRAIWVAGTVQDGVVWSIFDAFTQANGLASRFLLANPPDRLQLYNVDVVLTPKTEKRYTAIVQMLRGEPMQIDSATKLKKSIVHPLSPEALGIYAAFADEYAQKRFDEPDDSFRAVLSKLEGAALRIALIYHLVSWAGQALDAGFKPRPIELEFEESEPAPTPTWAAPPGAPGNTIQTPPSTTAAVAAWTAEAIAAQEAAETATAAAAAATLAAGAATWDVEGAVEAAGADVTAPGTASGVSEAVEVVITPLNAPVGGGVGAVETEAVGTEAEAQPQVAVESSSVYSTHIPALGPAFPPQPAMEVSAATIAEAITTIRWFEREMRRIYRKRTGMLSDSSESEDNEMIRFIAEDCGGKVTAYKLQKRFRSTLKRTSDADEFLGSLAADGRGRWLDGEGRDGHGRDAPKTFAYKEKLGN